MYIWIQCGCSKYPPPSSGFSLVSRLDWVVISASYEQVIHQFMIYEAMASWWWKRKIHFPFKCRAHHWVGRFPVRMVVNAPIYYWFSLATHRKWTSIILAFFCCYMHLRFAVSFSGWLPFKHLIPFIKDENMPIILVIL